jgi:hypothetical protein
MKSVIAATLKNLESQVAALRAALNEMPEISPVQPKEKRELSPAILKMNGERGAIFEELKAAWCSAHPEYAALDAEALKSAVKSGAVPAKPRFSEALQEHSRRLRENDPAKQAKYEAYRKVADAKTAKIQAARAAPSAPASVSPPPSAPASVVSATSEKKERKNPWLGLTDEQKAEKVAKMTAGKLAKKEAAAASVSVAAAVPVAVPSASNPFDDAPVSDAESSTSSKKRGPPKGVKLSEEERVKRAAKAKATRDAKKVAGAAAVPLPASPPPSSASSVIVDEIDEETFTKQQIGSKIVYKNALGHVRAYTTEGAGIWLGMYDPVKKVIDASVPEPAE